MTIFTYSFSAFSPWGYMVAFHLADVKFLIAHGTTVVLLLVYFEFYIVWKSTKSEMMLVA